MKYIIVTGANGGLGKTLISELAKDDVKIFAFDIAFDQHENDEKISFLKCDISKKDQILNHFETIKKETHHIDAIINLAGIYKMESIVEGEEDTLRKIIDINFFGTYNLNRIFFSLLDSKSRIINMSSELAQYSPQPFCCHYALTKKMIDCYSDTLRRECNYLGIKVIKIECGSMKTNMLVSASNQYSKLLQNTTHFSKQLTKLKYMMDNELKKTNNPSFVANAIIKALNKKNPKLVYRIKRSFKLRLLNSFPERLQDKIYLKVIK